MPYNPEFFSRRDTCPVCDQETGDVFYCKGLLESPVIDFIESHYRAQGHCDRAILQGTDYELSECGRCRLTYQVNVPLEHTLVNIYTKMISADFLRDFEKKKLTLGNFNNVSGELLSLFRMSRKRPTDIKFLDYGFGYGRWASVARAMGAQVYGTEIGDDKRAAASALGIRFLTDREIESERYDIIHTEQVFEHLIHPGQDFSRLSRLCDGIFKVAVPRHFGTRSIIETGGLPKTSPFERELRGEKPSAQDKLFVALQPLEHLNVYSDRTMEWLAEKNGLSIVRTSRRRDFVIETEKATNLAKISLEIAKNTIKSFTSTGGYYIFSKLR